ncbi:unnamed protein product, partial [Phaeothamnion confervicola]
MNQHEQLLNLCGGFYDAALDPSAWSDVLARVAACLGAVGADLHLLDDDVLRCNYMGMQPREVLEEYAEKFLDREPRSLSLRQLAPGQVITDLQIVNAHTMRNHPYYADFLPRIGLGHCIAATPLKEARHRAYFGVHLAPASGAPSEDMLALVKAMQPHLGRAVSAQFRMMDAELRNHVYTDALDRVSCGVAILNGAGRLMLSNTAAQALFAHGQPLKLVQEHLTATVPAESRKLQMLIQYALTRRNLRGGATIVHGAGQRALCVTVDATSEEFRQRTGAAAYVYITDLHARPCRDHAQQLRDMFGLTPAETRIAIGIAAGEPVREVARQAGVTYESARFTLKRVYEKLGVHKQGELVALIQAALP